jgi:Ser/Thr protein kinase RdoA (MazF antagonist)
VDLADICDVFRLGAPTGPMSYAARGELGRVSRVVTTTGEWAVKEIDSFLPSVDEADANVELQESMLASGVNLPRPRRTVDGHGLYGNVRVYEWLDMTPIALGVREVEKRVAAALARVHVHAPLTDRSPDPWYCRSMIRVEWDVLLEQGARMWWATVIAGLVHELVDLERPQHFPARVCHLDVCPENVFLANGQLTIIDWENAGPAATLQDLGSTLWDFCRGDIERTRAFVDHYRRHGGPIEHFGERVFDMARVVQANLVAHHCRRTLDPGAISQTRRRAEEALRACLAQPLTSQVIDRLIAVPRHTARKAT